MASPGPRITTPTARTALGLTTCTAHALATRTACALTTPSQPPAPRQPARLYHLHGPRLATPTVHMARVAAGMA
ncbi:hypothetical protein ACWDA3_09825 [Nonomuraea rubra]